MRPFARSALLVHYCVLILCLVVLGFWPTPIRASVPPQFENSLVNAGYESFGGDVNSDGYPDVLLKAKNQIILIDYEIAIPVLLRWRDSFIVLSNPDGSYSILLSPPPSMLNSPIWQPGTHELIFGDTDGDGSQELLVRARTTNGISALITSSSVNGTPTIRQRLNGSDLGGTDLGTSGLVIDLTDTDGDGRADLVTGQGILIQSIYLANSAGIFPSNPSPTAPPTVAGATAGQFNVTNTGAASYDIPFSIPPGPNGMQPSLGLRYDSRRGYGTVGPGWSISGLGAISRCNKTYAQDTTPSAISLAASDGYCLDGRRLRLTGGTYGAASSTYQTEVADFSQITAYGAAGNGPAYFYAQRKDGLIYEYGNSNGGSNTARVTASGSSTPYQWRLNKVRDRNGNNYTVTYGVGQTGSVGVGVPLSVSYTPTSSGASSYRYSVSFTYMTDTSDGTETGYIAGGSTINNNLLTRVEIKQLDANKSLRTYALSYEFSPTTSRRRLISVQECSDSGLTSCLSPTVINYQDGGIGASGTSNNVSIYNTNSVGIHDLNGDGRQDILYESGNALYVNFGSSAGFGGAFNTGIVLVTGDKRTVGDLVASGRDDILVTRNGVWYRYYWNGSAFVGVSSSISTSSDEQAASLRDVNGDGLPDLVTIYKPVGTARVHIRINTSSNGALSFSSTRTSVYNTGCAGCSSDIYLTTGRQGFNEDLDFNGDGRADIAVFTEHIPDPPYFDSFELLSNGSTFQAIKFSSFKFLAFANWNDDACTDIVNIDSIIISSCNGTASQTLPYSGSYLGVMDWNGDGRTDLLVGSSGNIGIRLSTGGGIGALLASNIPIPPSLQVGDVDGDGLDDIVSFSSTAPSSLTYRLHGGAGSPPDLATSITDGLGVNFSPAYGSIVQSNYTKGSGAVAPERDLQTSIYVVKQFQASDGIGGTYTRTFSYSGAREDTQGRGFSGFQSITISDSRPSSTITKAYYTTAFPYTGLRYQQDVYQHNGTSLISHSVNTPATTTLSAAANQQRYFPYSAGSSTDTYEAGGSKNGQLITQRSSALAYDSYGNITSSTTTVTDKDGGAPQSPTYNQSWTTAVTNTFSPDTTNWCLGAPTRTTTTRSATGILAITRTVSFTPDYVKCRISQQVVEPDSATYKVTVDYGYDVFGNVNLQTVTGLGMSARTTSANWGVTGQFPLSITNALNQTSTATYDYGLGFQTGITDPNTLSSSQTPDAFGRVVAETRSDGTSTSYSYNKCTDVIGGCQNGDPSNAFTSINKLVIVLTEKDVNGNAIRDNWVYLDQLGRAIVEKSKTLTGSYSRVGAQYDVYGRLYRQSEPCDAANCSVYWTTNIYDQLGRPIDQSRRISALDSGQQTTSLSYQGMTATVTDAYLKTTTKSVDPNGLVRRSKDHDGYYQSFSYDAFGSVVAVTDSLSNTLFSATYDYGLAAFRRQAVDADLGTSSFTPNALGEVVSSTDASGTNFSQTYDKLSRRLTRVVPSEGTTTWTWGNAAASFNIGQLQSLSSTGGTTETYGYDSKGRLNQLQVVSDTTYTYNASFSATTGLLDTLTYPTSTSSYRLKLQYGYQNGLLEKISDYNASGTVFWQASAMNARFQVTQEKLGNGIVTNSGFDPVNGRLSTLQSGVGGGSGVQNEAYQYDKLGNLSERKNLATSLTENFYYDNLYRLDYAQLNGTTNLDLSYNALGNITTRCEPTCGAAWTYHTTKKHAVTQASVGSTTYNYGYDSNGNVTSRNGYSITWSKDNYPTLINGSNESIALFYDASFQRWKQVYTQGGITETTIYAGGLLEKVTKGGVTDWRHSIRANGRSVALVSRTSTSVNTTRYVLEDHQGSVAKLLDNGGATLVSESFSAFGARRSPSTWSGAPSGSDLTTINSISRSGFTGQDALGALGLNHMNGRVQDTFTGRFLSADPFITEPGNAQNFNRYSYVSNNPLSFTDPTGFDVAPTGHIKVDVFPPIADLSSGIGGIVGDIASWIGDLFGGLFGGGGHGPPPPPAEPAEQAGQDSSLSALLCVDSACLGVANTVDGEAARLSGVSVDRTRLPVQQIPGVNIHGSIAVYPGIYPGSVGTLGAGIGRLLFSIASRASLAFSFAFPSELGDDTVQFVVRGGLAKPENLIAGSTPVRGYPGISGFSVITAPGLTVTELAMAGRYKNDKISYTTVAELRAIGVPVVPTPNGFNVLHATALITLPLEPGRAALISSKFKQAPNPYRVK